MSQDLLPLNATPQERALSLATGRVVGMDIPNRELWNPQTCPAALLPWLAWALHVDDWDSGWSERQKRNVIAASFIVHKLKGTVGAVKRVANSFGTTVLIQEWWQTTPQGAPHTFTATFSIPTAVVEQQESIVAAITAAKPARSAMTAQVVNTLQANVGVPGFVRLATFDRFNVSLN